MILIRAICLVVLGFAIYFAVDQHRKYEEITSLDQLLTVPGRVDSIARTTDSWRFIRGRKDRRDALKLASGPEWYITATRRGNFSPHNQVAEGDTVTLYVRGKPDKTGEVDLFAGVIHDRSNYAMTFLDFDEVRQGQGLTFYGNPFWLLMVIMPLLILTFSFKRR